ncbi:hypothetical protein [Limimaricola cinnabarinus]|nr:hypothetical protein [Limimaricola cinnabarinus]
MVSILPELRVRDSGGMIASHIAVAQSREAERIVDIEQVQHVGSSCFIEDFARSAARPDRIDLKVQQNGRTGFGQGRDMRAHDLSQL